MEARQRGNSAVLCATNGAEITIPVASSGTVLDSGVAVTKPDVDKCVLYAPSSRGRQVMNNSIVPPKEGRAFHVGEGQRIRIISPKGHQAADFFAYNAASVAEWLSPPHTWIASCSITPRPGDIFMSRFRRPMMRMLEDGANGVHDMLRTNIKKE